MSLGNICHTIETSSLVAAMQHWSILLPGVKTLHVLAMVTLVGSITTFDLRLLGVVMRRLPVSRVAKRFLPCTWAAFGVMIVTGPLIFAAAAESKYCFNPAFRIKLVLILLAGLNMSVFHLTIYRSVSSWDDAPVPPLRAKLAGALSALLWAGVTIAARWISFA